MFCWCVAAPSVGRMLINGGVVNAHLLLHYFLLRGVHLFSDIFGIVKQKALVYIFYRLLCLHLCTLAPFHCIV